MEILIIPMINPDIDLDEGVMLTDCDGTGCKHDYCSFFSVSIGMCC